MASAHTAGSALPTFTLLVLIAAAAVGVGLIGGRQMRSDPFDVAAPGGDS